jgi:hypothetical protein
MKTTLTRLSFIFLLVALLAACASVKASSLSPAVQVENQYAPQSADGKLTRDTVEMVKTEAATLQNNPSKVELKVFFFLPTPCDQFRINVSQPGADKRINVEVYSLMKPNQVCALMRLSTPTEADLNLAGLASGHYSVWVNGEKSLEFDL